jgi:hypothetical protein
MKKFFVAFIFTCSVIYCKAQIGLGVTTPHPNAYFQVNSTNRGVLLPRMNALQRIAIAPSATANGLIVFDIDSTAYMFWTGSAWKKIGGDDNNWIKDGNNIYNGNTRNVGIGTNTPLARLHVADSAVLFASPAFSFAAITQLPPVQGAGVRMMWYPQRAAFRAGVVDDGSFLGNPPGTYDDKIWDRDSIGIYSFAAGYNAKAKGQGDVVAGLLNESTGSSSAVFGENNKSYGYSNFSAGNGNRAYGNYNVNVGEINNTHGSNTIAIGKNNQVSDSGIVMGTLNITGLFSNIALGQYNRALGAYTTAIGLGNLASSIYTFAAGYNSVANSQGAVAIGMNNVAGSDYSSAFGYSNVANSPGGTVVGMFNDPFDFSQNRIFQVGNGSSSFTRSNAMTILHNGNVGIGTVAPNTTLEVAGNASILGGFFQYANGTEGLGKVLASDAAGIASWQQAADVWPVYWSTNGTDIFNNNTGNVGIGTTDPVSPLSFASTMGNKISLWGIDASNQYGMGVAGGLLQLYAAYTADNIGFGFGSSTNFTERMRVKGDGNVGIGNTDPAYILDVNNRVRIRSGGDPSNSAGIWLNTNDNSSLQSFIGNETDNTVGFYGTGSGWSFTMNTATGKVKIADGTQAAGRILSSDANGVASWVNSTAITSAVTGIFAGGGTNLTTAMGAAYLNTYIDLPPGKWIVLGTYLLSQGGSGGAMLAGQSMWVRTFFSSSNVANIPTGDIIGSGLMSGSIGHPSPFAVINGQNIVNNTSGATKRYYVWGLMSNTGGQPAGFSLDGLGSNFWSENQLTAVPMN